MRMIRPYLFEKLVLFYSKSGLVGKKKNSSISFASQTADRT